MRFLKKIAEKEKELFSPNAVTIVFLGDSTTQGCFECYMDEQGKVSTVFETEQCYGTKFKSLLQRLYPRAQINAVNSGISGDVARRGLERLEDSVLRYRPDLTIVSYGLNDCNNELVGVEAYRQQLSEIFEQLVESGSEVIFLAPCMMNTYVSASITDAPLQKIAENTMRLQNDGVLEAYFGVARETAAKYGVAFCDCYSKWMQMKKAGVDTTALLSNRINHPSRDMHWVIAYALLDIVFEM